MLLYFSPRGQWMDYRCRFGSLGYSSTASVRIELGGTVGSAVVSGLRDSFFSFSARFPSFHIHSQCLGKTRVHKFHVFYSQTEWYLLFFLQCDYTSAQCAFGAKIRNNYALVNLYL